MPTVFAHSLIGLTASQSYRPSFSVRETRVFIGFSVALPVLPDLDGVPLVMSWIPYGHMLGHRGFTHSLFAAVLLGALATAFMARGSPAARRIWPRLWLYFSVVAATHGLLDMATSGGMGIALLSPLDNSRLFFPFRPILVSPIRGFVSRAGLNAMLSEVATIWTICLALLIWSNRLSSVVQAVSSGVTKTVRSVEERHRVVCVIVLILLAVLAWVLRSAHI